MDSIEKVAVPIVLVIFLWLPFLWILKKSDINTGQHKPLIRIFSSRLVVFLVALFLVKGLWHDIVTALFPGAVQNGSVAAEISIFDSLNLILFGCAVNCFGLLSGLNEYSSGRPPKNESV